MKDLMIEMLKKTLSYQCGNVAFTEDKNGISLYSPRHGGTEVFFQPHVAAIFVAVGFSTYCWYNEEKKRVELKVYH